MKIILLFSLFLLLFMGLTALFGTIRSPIVLFLVLFMDPTALFGTIRGHIVLFQLTFIFIYSIFNNNFLLSAK